MAMNIRPLYDRIVVKRIEEPKESMSGSIIIPDTAKEKPQLAEVVAVGKLIALEVQVGDQILFGKYAGNEVPKSFGDEYLILREDEILGVLESGNGSAKKSKAS